MSVTDKMKAIEEAIIQPIVDKGQNNNTNKVLFLDGHDSNEPKDLSRSAATTATPVAKEKVPENSSSVPKNNHKQPSPKNKDNNLQECGDVKIVVNNTMLPFLYPLYLEKEKEKENIVCSITNTNHNQWNNETQRQIMFTFLGNPYDRVRNEERSGSNNTPGEDMEVLLVVAGKEGVKRRENIRVSEE